MKKKQSIFYAVGKTGSLLLLLVFAGMFTTSRAQTGTAALKDAQEHWWIDYANGLKSVIAEKNDHQAAILLTKIKDDLMPRFNQLVSNTQAWKKSHSQPEIQEMTAWNNANPHNQEVQSLQMSPNILMRTGKNKEFSQAYGNLIKAMMKAGNHG
jgi:hypothetical protein